MPKAARATVLVPAPAAAAAARVARPVVLSVVIPAFDEEATLGETLAKVSRFLARRDFGSELLVVDDGSSDGTAALARARGEWFPALRVLRHATRLGRGAAVRTGLLASRGSRILVVDADLPAAIDEAERLLAALSAGADLAVGTRRPRSRRVGATLRRWAERALVPTGVADSTCGFKALRAPAARELAPLVGSEGWAFDTELLALARRLAYRIAEVPVRWHDDRGLRAPFTSVLLEIVRDLRRVRRELDDGRAVEV